MLKALSFEGTTKVLNKGVDVALVIAPADEKPALYASKVCGVCGVSTAVLCVTQLQPVDKRTLSHFCQTAGRMVFADRALYEAVRHVLDARVHVFIAPEKNAKSFADTVLRSKRNSRNGDSNETT